jgi:CRP-like cAMP-binding protein
MNAGRAADIRHLRGLKNISWLSWRQLNRLAAAISISAVEKREVIIAEKHSPESAYILLSGVARISCRNRKGDRISLGVSSEDFKRMAASYQGRWDLVQLRCTNFMGCTLEERLALILLELSGNFGVEDKRGTRLMIPARHKDLADLVGASRPRVTEFLSQFERDNFLIRDGRHLIVHRDRLESFLAGAQPPRLQRVKKAA